MVLENRTLLFSTKLIKHFRSYSSNIPGLLTKINVLDLTRVIAGPLCSMTLGDLGANVIKIESLEGDDARRYGPFLKGSTNSAYFMAVNRNKKSVCINLKSHEGKQVIYDLAKKCDVMIENFVPGKLDKLGVGYEKLSTINPGLVYAAISGFGPTGPYSNRPGYDVIAAAMGGLLNCTGEKGGRPVKPGVPLTDIITGLHAFGAIMTALHHRDTSSGKGQKIDCNLLSSQISSMVNIASTYLNNGIDSQKMGSAHVSLAPCQVYDTSDGEMFIAVGSDAQFADLCELIYIEDLLKSEKFATNPKRLKNVEDLNKILDPIFKSKTKKEWFQLFGNASFPNGPVNNMKDVFEDEHVKAIGLVKELSHSEAGVVKVVGPPTVYSEGGNLARFAPPKKGEHTREILSQFLGYTNRRIDELYNSNSVR